MSATSVGEAKYGPHLLTNVYDYIPLLPQTLPVSTVSLYFLTLDNLDLWT
jgi:hypothetical protein